MIILLCGPARCGKDTIKTIIGTKLNNNRYDNIKFFSFASLLRTDLEQYVKEKYNVSIWDDKQKHLFRNDMINYGIRKRKETKGRYFIDNFIKLYNDDDNYIISDYRFYNEYLVLSNEIKTTIIPYYIQRYILIDNKKFSFEPEIEEEKIQYEIIKKHSKILEIPWIIEDNYYKKLFDIVYQMIL